MQSLWTIVLMNISLLSTVLGSILSLVLGLGFDLLNFFIEIIVFNTAVYYLLANSTAQWLPLKWFNDLLSSIQLTTDSGTFYKTRIVGAVENAIRFNDFFKKIFKLKEYKTSIKKIFF